jgi:hypothetical protein
MKKSFLFLGGLALSTLILSSCSKDNPVTPDPSPIASKNIKFTFSAPGTSVAEGDAVHFNIVGSDGTLNATLWKVNGVVRSNEQGFIIDRDQLATGGTFVVESVKPLYSASLSISAQNFGATTFKVLYKAEVNGTVENNLDENIVTSSGFIKNYTY